MAYRKTILVDFDGVCHKYEFWKGAAEGVNEPTKGVIEALTSYVEHFDVWIFSTRAATPEGVQAISDFLDTHLPEEVRKKIRITYKKVPATLTIDDRGFQFQGEWPTVEYLKEFKPYWKKDGYPS